MSNCKGKSLRIVNVASNCGFTRQYKALEALYQKYKHQDFIILAFPSNQFLQEHSSKEKIQAFCELNYHISFPLFAPIRVNG